jgi:phage baseplate assembly protein W
MDNTTSLSFPNLFDIARNTVAVKVGNASITNRTKLLILTEPTELYNNPTFGVGLKQYLWQYNTPNTKAIIQERIKNQLREHEPCVDPDKTQFSDGLLYTEGMQESSVADLNKLKMTVGLQTIYKDTVNMTIDLSEESKKLFGRE